LAKFGNPKFAPSQINKAQSKSKKAEDLAVSFNKIGYRLQQLDALCWLFYGCWAYGQACQAHNYDQASQLSKDPKGVARFRM